jgi:hypothetical protein
MVRFAKTGPIDFEDERRYKKGELALWRAIKIYLGDFCIKN